MALIDSAHALAEGLDALSRQDPLIAALVSAGAVPVLRKRPPGFEGLARIVVGQQVSTASADAIWGRLAAALAGEVSASTVGEAAEELLRDAGLSGPKIRALRSIAAAVQSVDLPLDALGDLGADAAHGLLTAVKGIGPWTADVYLLFCLGHADAFPAGDLALQEAARLALSLDARPDAKGLAAIAERWRPWRGVAAKVLWAHYRVAKGREGVIAARGS